MEEKKKVVILPDDENKEEEIRPLSLSEWAEQIKNKMKPKTNEVV